MVGDLKRESREIKMSFFGLDGPPPLPSTHSPFLLSIFPITPFPLSPFIPSPRLSSLIFLLIDSPFQRLPGIISVLAAELMVPAA